MDDNSILARMITGFAVKAIGAGLAIWIALTAVHFVRDAFAQTSAALEQVQSTTDAR